MATSGLYGNTAATSVTLPTGSESSGLYGNNTVFGGTYFEYFVFQDSSTQPATPTSGSWSFTTNTGTPPAGWSNSPPTAPNYNVWISIALVNSKNGATLTWSTPGVMGSTATGTVTSVGLSAPSFLSVSGSPVTNSGTLALSYSGSALPVVNGGTGTTSPNLVAGSNVTITGTWPNQTINSTNSGGTVTSVSGTSGRITSTGGTTPIIDLASGIATASTTGSSLLVPVITIDTYGRVTSISTASNPQGTVTSVTGTSPVVSSGGTTPAISMAAASTSTNGYLTSTDWNTFNGKGSGTVTNIATGTGLNGGPITSTGTISLANTAVTAGSYTAANITVDSQGRITSAANGSSGSGTVSSVAVSGGTTGLTTSGGPITTSGTITLAGTLAVSNGGTGVTASSGANSVVLRDANGNISANSINEGYSNVAAAGTTTVLIISSVPNYVVTGSGGQTYQLPDATTLNNGTNYVFNNNQSSGSIVVKNNSSTIIATVQSGGYVEVVLLSNSTAAGSWDVHNQAPSNVSWSTNTFDYPGSITSATWNGATIAVNRGGTGTTTSTGSGSVVLSISPSLVTPVLGTPTSGNFSTGTFTWPTFNQNTTGTAANITASSNSTLTTLSALSLPGSQVSGNISGNASNVTGTVVIANGGTGQTTAAAAITALSGTQTSGYYLRSNGTNTLLAAIVAGDVPTLNQNTTGTAANITASSNSTLTTLSALSLPGSQVSGNISGNAANVTGTIAVANGGTGQTTASASFNALSPITTTGDLIIGSGTNSATRLGIGANNYVLTSNGTTATWAASTSGVSQIIAGTNVTISPSGGTGAVTINASGSGGSSMPITKMQAQSFGGF